MNLIRMLVLMACLCMASVANAGDAHDPAHLISGTVRDDKGQPLQGMEIRVYRVFQNGAHEQTQCLNYGIGFSDRAVTKADGSFSIDLGVQDKNGPPSRFFLTVPPLVKVYTDETHKGYRQNLLLPSGQVGKLTDANGNALEGPPETDASGHAVGYVPLRYPTPTASDPEPTFELGSDKSSHIDFQFHPVSFHHVSGSISQVPSEPASPSLAYMVGVREDAKFYFPNDVRFYLVHAIPRSNLFDVWLPDGKFELYSGFTSGAGTFEGATKVTVQGQDVSNVALVIRSDAPVTVPLTIVKPHTCDPLKPGCDDFAADLFEIRFERYRDGKYLSVSEPSYRDRKDDHWSVKLTPGSYKIQMQATGQVYPAAERGGTDITGKLFEVTDSAQQPEIRIVLKKGGSIGGDLTQDGRPGSAYVYTLPVDPAGKAHFGFYQGTFKVEELAPGDYLLFSTPNQLAIDPPDPKMIDHWRPLARKVTLTNGEDASVDLTVLNGSK